MLCYVLTFVLALHLDSRQGYGYGYGASRAFRRSEPETSEDSQETDGDSASSCSASDCTGSQDGPDGLAEDHSAESAESGVLCVAFFSLMDSCQVNFWQDEVEPGQVDAPDSGAEGHR